MSRLFLTDVDFNNAGRVINMLDPASPQDAATRAYVDSVVQGLNWKDNVKAASGTNVNLTSPGAAINGVTMVSGDRFLAMGQTAPAENLIYTWSGAATPATRALDMNTPDEVEQAITVVEEGAFAGSAFRQTAINVTLGTSPLAWTPFGVVAPPASETLAGISAFATQAEVDAGVDTTKTVRPSTLAAWAGRSRVKTGTIGDGAATQFSVTHNWNTRYVSVEVFRNSGNYDTVMCDVSRIDANTIRFNFLLPPTANQFAYRMSTGGTP